MKNISFKAAAESARNAEQAGELLVAVEAWELASKAAKNVVNAEWASSRALFCRYLNKLKTGMKRKGKIPALRSEC
ncbi:TPA: ANR family transcriptional regulator [Klebsiella aerogenes]